MSPIELKTTLTELLGKREIAYFSDELNGFNGYVILNDKRYRAIILSKNSYSGTGLMIEEGHYINSYHTDLPTDYHPPELRQLHNKLLKISGKVEGK